MAVTMVEVIELVKRQSADTRQLQAKKITNQAGTCNVRALDENSTGQSIVRASRKSQ